MNKNSLTLSCPSCGQPISLQFSKVTEQPLIDKVKDTINDWMEDVDITEENDTVVVMPKGFLGKDVWYEINDALKSLDAEWVSAEKESRWIIKSDDAR